MSNPSKTPSKTPSEVRATVDSIWQLVNALSIQARDVEGRLGLSPAQVFVLQQLRDESPISLKELSRRVMADPDTVMPVVKRLSEKGLLTQRRSDKDGRLLELWISAEGKLKLRQCPDALQSRLIGAVSDLKAPRRKSLTLGLGGLLEAAGLSGGRPAMLLELD